MTLIVDSGTRLDFEDLHCRAENHMHGLSRLLASMYPRFVSMVIDPCILYTPPYSHAYNTWHVGVSVVEKQVLVYTYRFWSWDRDTRTMPRLSCGRHK